jgi:hypothetical protein
MIGFILTRFAILHRITMESLMSGLAGTDIPSRNERHGPDPSVFGRGKTSVFDRLLVDNRKGDFPLINP